MNKINILVFKPRTSFSILNPKYMTFISLLLVLIFLIFQDSWLNHRVGLIVVKHYQKLTHFIHSSTILLKWDNWLLRLEYQHQTYQQLSLASQAPSWNNVDKLQGRIIVIIQDNHQLLTKQLLLKSFSSLLLVIQFILSSAISKDLYL